MIKISVIMGVYNGSKKLTTHEVTFLQPSILMRRDVLLEVTGYTTGPQTERTEDFDLWCKLYEKG